VDEILQKGAAKARQIASAVLERAERACGLKCGLPQSLRK
jgi:hypothetical protein